MTTTGNRFYFLDGLRGIAALAVVLYHHYLFLNGATGLSFSQPLEFLLLKGHLGVQIFFVLSGFVIAYSIRNATLSWKYLGRFFIKRSIRLDPPYWVALSCMIAATTLFSLFISKQGWPFSSDQIAANALYVQQFFGVDSINPVAWTLCIELQLYLFFVFILQVLFQTCRRNSFAEQLQAFQSPLFSLFFLLFFIGSLACHYEESKQLLTEWSPAGLFYPYWYSFFIGVAICWTLLGRMSQAWLASLFSLVGICLLLQFDDQMVAVLITALTIFWVGKKGCLENFTLSSVFQYLGKISFSLYLIHWLAGSNSILFLSKRIGEMTMLKLYLVYFFSIAVSIFAAHLFYRWVEAPCLRWSKAFSFANRKLSN